MKSIFLKSSVFALSFAFLSVGHIAVVDAKRLGGGSNVGRSANAQCRSKLSQQPNKSQLSKHSNLQQPRLHKLLLQQLLSVRAWAVCWVALPLVLELLTCYRILV